MKRVVNGMHVSNSRHWHIEQMLRAARAMGAVTILHFMMFPKDDLVGQWGDVENAYWYWKLRHGWGQQGIPAAPERFIHVRMFQPNWRDFDPAVVARKSVELLCNWRFEGLSADLWQDPFVGVSPCNEQNLEPVGNKEYSLHAVWQLKFWQEMDRILPNRKALSVLGAWAYGGDVTPDVPDSEYQVPEVKQLLSYVDVLATHPYAHLNWPNGAATADPRTDGYWHLLRDFRPEGWRDSRQPGRPHDIGGILAQVPGKPLLITETGTFTHSNTGMTQQTIQAMSTLYTMAAASGRVIGCTPFIWNSGEEHGDNLIWPNEALRNAFETMPDYPTTCTLPVRGAQPMGYLNGVDVSQYQGQIDWGKMKAKGVAFAWIRAGGGGGKLDSRFAENVTGAMSHGIPWGPYWWYGNGLDGRWQTDAFAACIKGRSFDLPPMLDWELEDATLTLGNLERAFTRCDELLGRPMMYTSPGWANKHGLSGAPWLAKYPLFVAHYTGAAKPIVPAPWTGWAVWQWSAGGNGRGPEHGASSSDLDLNRYAGTIAQLKAMKQAPTSQPIPDPKVDVGRVRGAAKVEQEQRGVRLNPGAGIQRTILADGLVPVTNEIDYEDASGRYVLQVGEGLQANALHLAYLWNKATGKITKVGL